MAQSITLERASTFITLDAAGEATDTETIVIAGKTYTFLATVGTDDGAVHIGATVEDTVNNLAAAINLDPSIGETGTEGTDYGEEMTVNPHVFAVVNADEDEIALYSKIPGAIGNFITVGQGTSTITLDNATLENGAGDAGAFFDALFALNQINAELVDELRQFSTIEGGLLDGVTGAP